MNYGFDFSFVEEFWHSLLVGAWLTTKMAVVSLLLGFLLGVALAIARTEGGAVPRKLAAAFVDLTRNTPLIVQTFWLFFGLASIDIRVTAFYAAIAALNIQTRSDERRAGKASASKCRSRRSHDH